MYIYLFTKRFYLVLRYFKHIIQKYVVGFIRLVKDGKKSSVFQSPGAKTSQSHAFMRLLKGFIKIFKFLYSLFIVIQLSILAVIESKRIKDFLTMLIYIVVEYI